MEAETNPREAIRYSLNAFEVTFHTDRLRAFVRSDPLHDAVKRLREELGDEWFLHRDGTEIYGVPLAAEPKHRFGESECDLPTTEHKGLSILNHRLNEFLPTLLPNYDPLAQRPFSFLAQKHEFVDEITRDWNVRDVVRAFKIRPRFSLESRILELREGVLQAVLVLRTTMQWDVTVPVSELIAAGLALNGQHVIRFIRRPGERSYVGVIKDVAAGVVRLGERMEEDQEVSAVDVKLEGSKAAFRHCLSRLMGQQRYEQFDKQREELEAEFTTGPAINQVLVKWATTLRKKGRFQILPGIEASLGNTVVFENGGGYASFKQLDPVAYCFNAAKTETHEFAWDGLKTFGPYDRDSFEARSPRILVVAPASVQGPVEQAIKQLNDGVPGSAYPISFARLFHLINPRFEFCPVSDERTSASEVALRYQSTIQRHLVKRHDYSAAVVAIPDKYAHLPDECSPYLFSKATLLMNAIPVQEARLATLTRDRNSIAYSLRNIAVALYAKMNGVPWTVSHNRTYSDELVIGLGMAELSGSRVAKRQRHMGITTVFEGDGNYLLSNVSRECSYEEYPQVLKQTTIDVLADLKRRNGWQPRERVRIVFHSSKPLKNAEIDELMAECVQAVAGEQTVDFASLAVLHDHPFKVLDHRQPGLQGKWGAPKGQLSPDRGFMAQLGAATRLLATNGPRQAKRQTTPLPTPLLIHLHKHSTSRHLDALAEQVLKFTSLTWRSTLPADSPVTIYYSELIADLLARLKKVPGWSPAVLNTKLQASKWFL